MDYGAIRKTIAKKKKIKKMLSEGKISKKISNLAAQGKINNKQIHEINDAIESWNRWWNKRLFLFLLAGFFTVIIPIRILTVFFSAIALVGIFWAYSKRRKLINLLAQVLDD